MKPPTPKLVLKKERIMCEDEPTLGRKFQTNYSSKSVLSPREEPSKKEKIDLLKQDLRNGSLQDRSKVVSPPRMTKLPEENDLS